MRTALHIDSVLGLYPGAQRACVDILSTPSHVFVLLWREQAPRL